MIGTLVITHGTLANELVEVARRIAGALDNVRAVSIDWNDDASEARKRIESALHGLDPGRGILILTDMFGGTPTNLALTFLEKDRVAVVTGVNLPMLLKAASLSGEEGVAAVASKVRAQGQKSIYVASDILAHLEG